MVLTAIPIPRIAWLLLATWLVMTASVVQAQEQTQPPQTTNPVIETAEPTGPVVRADGGGFSLTSADGDFHLRLRSYLQPAARFFLDDEDSRREQWTPEIGLRVGKAKTPFGLERLQSGTALYFLEPNLPSRWTARTMLRCHWPRTA